MWLIKYRDGSIVCRPDVRPSKYWARRRLTSLIGHVNVSTSTLSRQLSTDRLNLWEVSGRSNILCRARGHPRSMSIYQEVAVITFEPMTDERTDRRRCDSQYETNDRSAMSCTHSRLAENEVLSRRLLFKLRLLYRQNITNSSSAVAYLATCSRRTTI